MPCFLRIWLDFTDKLTTDKTPRQNNSETEKMNALVNQMLGRLPLYYFYTAFSQLVSRICHPNMDTLKVLQTIIIKLIKHHPQQSMWLLVGVFKSANPMRVKRCTEMFTDERLSDDVTQKLIRDFNLLSDKLLELNAYDLQGQSSKTKVTYFLFNP